MYSADVTDRYARDSYPQAKNEKVVMSYDRPRQPVSQITLQRQTAALLMSITGRRVSDEWAAKVIRFVLEGKNPADPWRYIRGAILGSGDPEREFLPITAPGHH